MTAAIIDGKAISNLLRKEIAREVEEFRAETGITPGLAVILVGDDPASQTYVRNKERSTVKVGMYSEVHRLPAETSQQDLLNLVNELNNDPKIHGILVQLPLPRHIDENTVIEAIAPGKDVDGFHAVNAGRLLIGQESFLPCTPYGIMELLKHEQVELKGKHAVVVGRSNIVGKPVALLLLREHATVTICHSRTADLGAMTRQADVLVVAVGKPNFITGDMIKPGAVVIDVGINRVDDQLVGDVEFASAKEVAGKITPVPGGVGPMTITMLLKNTLLAAKRC
ncbi:MAG: bifunctional methylenetetrahydrofolate dehydrogenase/methenyltetrahydrofolate cyclohydrolase FolD [Firmicutes bacterium]|nr:bifunctional methylenetetrahydrofolate dehydrogenase/methenyltetrahydrofolate cyclohydrolase FolD [Bacillota bacterium]HOB35007.1 bifunctional methylenetetrahydrofolate dehydrogenase/methenyltetrahydrofolate cyclohydrolase FolD [Bacillota bacterium]HPZ90326.1 bifunctional methylenetetrahydrofolate dehydrogenase/methenyltetrahydrofolate cyclohydrolase FolD [Bacillota bacterium]HQE01831.1 bifunctional methylenetetrahydrofolate dehydrogenase/methenyltetrahydrofolate cyclohydrolase FolD [Bacillot